METLKSTRRKPTRTNPLGIRTGDSLTFKVDSIASLQTDGQLHTKVVHRGWSGTVSAKRYWAEDHATALTVKRGDETWLIDAGHLNGRVELA